MQNKRKNYQDESIKLAKAIDIAIEILEKFKANNPHYKSSLKYLLELKHLTLNPEPQFKTIASLKYIIDEFLTPYQEGAGLDVEHFWQKLKEEKLDYKRENKIKKILHRGKIINDIEYVLSTDMVVAAVDDGIISHEDSNKLSKMIEEYENRQV